MRILENNSKEKAWVFNSGKIILASQSPRRKELLRNLSENFEVIPSEVDEVIYPSLSPGDNALAIARDKALWVAKRYKEKIIIGADTIVVLDGKIIGKPKDEGDAWCILKMLCGRQHQVITGLVVLNPKKELFEGVAISIVNMKVFAEKEILNYIRTGEGLDKAGAYAIQGKGAFMIESYKGSYSNIVGLPLETLKTLLLQAVETIDS